MSIATDSETTSVEARERWLPRELRRKGLSRFGSYQIGDVELVAPKAALERAAGP
jgi:hypothetical protein